MGVVDVTKQFIPGLIEVPGSIIVAYGMGDVIQHLEGDAGFEVLSGVGQGFQLLIGSHYLVVAVTLSNPALVIDFLGGEEAGAMEVEIEGEHLLGEAVDLLGETTGDMGIVEMLTHHRAVLGFYQGVVIGAAGA